MPCGGIYPMGDCAMAASMAAENGLSRYPCWYCSKPGSDLVLEEWDSVIHSACVPAFLLTEEGQVVLHHQHEVTIIEDGKPKTLHQEGE
jgi:hypothetical protein